MQDNQQNGQFYTPAQNQNEIYGSTALQPTMTDNQMEDVIQWTASEFIKHDKTVIWYLGLAAITAIVATGAYFLLKNDVFSFVIIIVLGVIFGIAGSRKPRILNYILDEEGITVADKHYFFDSFKSFSVNDETPVASLVFLPTQRFSPSLTIYVPDEMIDNIIDTVGAYLPQDQHEDGYFDKFLNKIKF